MPSERTTISPASERERGAHISLMSTKGTPLSKTTVSVSGMAEVRGAPGSERGVGGRWRKAAVGGRRRRWRGWTWVGGPGRWVKVTRPRWKLTVLFPVMIVLPPTSSQTIEQDVNCIILY